ncbi:MAG: hypothetical protein IJO81_03110 [Clostridia bacterium]|nr:hypothetical protein [Clostridia bacterium]
MRFNFKEPPEAERHRAYEGETLSEANEELRRLRCWLYALTEQLEYVIGKEAPDNSGK